MYRPYRAKSQAIFTQSVALGWYVMPLSGQQRVFKKTPLTCTYAIGEP